MRRSSRGSRDCKLRIFGLFLGLIFLFPASVHAKVSGACSNCHTMHYSQNGTVPSGWGQSGPYQALLVNDCVGCHSSPDSETIKEIGGNDVPIVYNAQEPTKPLAGGNFYWVANGCDECGHNVTAIPAVSQDPNFSQTPGFVKGKTCSCCHGAGNMVLTKCVFCHNPKHHGDDSGPVVGLDDTTENYHYVKPKYRFLSFDYFHPYTFQEGAYNFYGGCGYRGR